MKKKSWKAMTAEEFDALKALQEAGVSKSMAHKATGRAWATIDKAYNSTDFRDYKTERIEIEVHSDDDLAKLKEELAELQAEVKELKTNERIARIWRR